ncbi:MAG TPA: HAMP domain-containing sensor histidine kinase [Streptosporangiaceae bacterium]|nr:HAMP domain-containing sensor histidine kinase [Streptosporangiaceae bacterium]
MSTRPAPGTQRPHRLSRLAALLSLRTISGKLIIGLVVLLGAASIIVSVVTSSSLNKSLMSSVDQQLQSATMRWQHCVSSSPDGDTDVHHGAGQGPLPACYGQAAGTFEAELTGNTFSNLNLVPGRCGLSAADEQTLLALHTTQVPGAGPGAPARPGGPDMPSYTRTLASLDGDYRLTKIQISSSEILVTGLPLATVQGTLNDVANTEHVVFAAVLLLVLVAGTAMVQLSLRPLRRVAATATKVTELPLDSGEVTLPAGVPDSDPRTEVGRVGAAFNRMLFHVERALGRRAASEARLRRFAADASHELRTPLSAIRGYAELALRHPGPVPGDVTHALRRVESESARMSVLVDDLLLLARLDAGRPLEREPVDLSRLAIETTSDARVARGDHRWRLELPGEPVLVEGDEHRLHQVLANMLSNAGKHTPPGSTVSVALTVSDAAASPEVPAAASSTSVVQRGVAPPGPRVELSITDDGPGISAELLPELFERFTRGEAGRARDASAAGKSTGLGLAIVDAVVAAHGGAIVVISHPGMTRFAILLPLLHDPAGQPQVSPV